MPGSTCSLPHILFWLFLLPALACINFSLIIIADGYLIASTLSRIAAFVSPVLWFLGCYYYALIDLCDYHCHSNDTTETRDSRDSDRKYPATFLHSLRAFLPRFAMVDMFSRDLFLRLPPSAVLLVLSTLFSTAHSSAVPRQTKTVPYTELDVLPWPLPTPMPNEGDSYNPFLLNRQLNTVCGYIGGDPDLPATCSAGSHCAVDVEHSAIGCCPDGGACTSGVYTGCVDRNSGPQTEINPYVFTCGGGDVCYQNAFDGGYFQYGCGSSSNIAATVVASASGRDPINLSSVAVQLTAEATSLAEPTTLGTADATSSATSSETDSSTTENTSTENTSTTASDENSTSTDSSATSTSSTTSTNEPDAPDNNDDDGGSNVGAIVGGTIGGVAFLALLGVLALYLLRRKKGNMREGPQNQGKQYIG